MPLNDRGRPERSRCEVLDADPQVVELEDAAERERGRCPRSRSVRGRGRVDGLAELELRRAEREAGGRGRARPALAVGRADRSGHAELRERDGRRRRAEHRPAPGRLRVVRDLQPRAGDRDHVRHVASNGRRRKLNLPATLHALPLSRPKASTPRSNVPSTPISSTLTPVLDWRPGARAAAAAARRRPASRSSTPMATSARAGRPGLKSTIGDADRRRSAASAGRARSAWSLSDSSDVGRDRERRLDAPSPDAGGRSSGRGERHVDGAAPRHARTAMPAAGSRL